MTKIKFIGIIFGRKSYKSGKKCFCEIEGEIYACSKDFEPFDKVKKNSVEIVK